MTGIASGKKAPLSGISSGKSGMFSGKKIKSRPVCLEKKAQRALLCLNMYLSPSRSHSGRIAVLPEVMEEQKERVQYRAGNIRGSFGKGSEKSRKQ